MKIIHGKSHPPARMVVFGPPGVGKSTFACGAPGVLALDYEQGLDEIGPNRVTGAGTWAESLELIKEACSGTGEHQTVVVDTIDRLEDQATEEVCRVGVKGKSMPDLGAFGYGDGYEALLAKWREFLFLLEGARAKGREVILVAHVQSKTQDDPQLGNYNKFIAALSKRCWGATHRWADAILFAQFESGLVEGRVVLSGDRILHSTAGSGYDAKNRWNLPSPLPLSWEAFDTARKSVRRNPENIVKSILELAHKLDPKTFLLAEGYIKEANGDTLRLATIENALKKKVG